MSNHVDVEAAVLLLRQTMGKPCERCGRTDGKMQSIRGKPGHYCRACISFFINKEKVVLI